MGDIDALLPPRSQVSFLSFFLMFFCFSCKNCGVQAWAPGPACPLRLLGILFCFFFAFLFVNLLGIHPPTPTEVRRVAGGCRV